MHDIFYFTDIHGNLKLYNKIVQWCIKQDSECTIICGGDACDRGDFGYEIMRQLLKASRFIYLKGNHEDVFVHAANFILRDYKGELEQKSIERYLHDCYIENFYSNEVKLSIINGGIKTLTDWMLDGMSKDFVNQINNLYITFSYNNIDFCHAGGSYKTFVRVANDEYFNNAVDLEDQKEMLWDRNAFNLGWKNERICVHGHTPTICLPSRFYNNNMSKKNIHPIKYCGKDSKEYNGYKIDMDAGAAIYGRAYVLNVLTGHVYGFDEIQSSPFENFKIL